MKSTKSRQTRAIENGFPIGFVSQLAEHESWRKEVYRPMYYIHKWWARRLGSVLRATLIASEAGQDADIAQLFYEPVKFPKVVVFDPFMGSGTTIGEALKLGCRVIGRDINPVSYLMVSTAVENYSRDEVVDAFAQIDRAVGEQIRALYRTHLPSGEAATVLYYFWVKTVPCLNCDTELELFKTRIFSRHATPSKEPHAKALCPTCHAINDVRHDDVKTTCQDCGTTYNPQQGCVKQSTVTCPACGAMFAVIDAVRKLAGPPRYKLYAKMVLTDNGQKEYWPITSEDLASYAAAERQLVDLWPLIPQGSIQPGYNTDQVLKYHYEHWYQMFNARQLVALGLLSQAIAQLPSPSLKTLFACLLSGTLEFNNMFASFKGEGTGAVRHMFAHHILKPELMPLEANVWGTPKSSGSFSTLFQSRVMRMLDYKDRPFELKISGANGSREAHKVYDLSQAVNAMVVPSYDAFTRQPSAYLSLGDSAHTDLPDQCVDVVLTDPPFFDNVHYSQLADFFYVWLRQMLNDQATMPLVSTRSTQEVQDTDATRFGSKLTAVWAECGRVLKDDGLLVFTYHHSRLEGWRAVYQSVRQAGFQIVRSHPVKAEMSVAVPIQQSKEPINFDLIMICRKSAAISSTPTSFNLDTCLLDAQRAVRALMSSELSLTRGDVRVILMGCILAQLANLRDFAAELSTLNDLENRLEGLVKAVLDQSSKSTVIARPTPIKRVAAKVKPISNQDVMQLKLLERKVAYRAKPRKTDSTA
jgi:adenine-specific DNA methylase